MAVRVVGILNYKIAFIFCTNIESFTVEKKIKRIGYYFRYFEYLVLNIRERVYLYITIKIINYLEIN